MKKVSLHKKLAGLLSRFSWLFGLVVCIVLSSMLAQAQTVEFTQNPSANHAMTFQVPLASYPGRGVSMPVTLQYSTTGLWRVGFLNSIQLSGNVRRSVAEAVYAEHSTSGWTTSLDVPKVEWPRQNDVYWYTGKPYAQGTLSPYTFRVAKLFMHMPDGSTHEMRKADAVYQDNGTIDMVGIFYAVDSSRTRYDSTGPSTGTLYLPDGSRYILGNNTTQYIDINGNTLKYDADSRQWTDTMGRVIGMPWPANPGVGDYTYSLSGLDIPYTLKFRSLSDVLSPDAQSLRPTADYFLYFPDQPPSGSNFPQATGAPALFASGYSDDAEPPSPSSYTYVVGRGQSQNSLFNPTVLAEIVMPNGQSYKFSYNNYGELDRVFYPTGGYQRYEYSAVPAVGLFSDPYVQGSRGIISRWVSPNGTGGSDEAQWTYSKSTSPMVITAPDGTRTEIYLFYPTSFFTNNFGYEDARNSAPIEQRVYAPASQGGAMLRRSLTEFAETTITINKPKVQGVSNPGTYTAHRNARPVKTVSLILDTGGNALAKTVTYEYASNGFEFKSGLDRTATAETNFAPIDQTTAQTAAIASMPVGTTARRSETTYLNTTAYQSRNLLGLPREAFLKES